MRIPSGGRSPTCDGSPTSARWPDSAGRFLLVRSPIMQIRGIVQRAVLEENPAGSDRIEMILWGQGVGPDKPRWIVIPYELLLSGSLARSRPDPRPWISGEHPRRRAWPVDRRGDRLRLGSRVAARGRLRITKSFGPSPPIDELAVNLQVMIDDDAKREVLLDPAAGGDTESPCLRGVLEKFHKRGGPGLGGRSRRPAVRSADRRPGRCFRRCPRRRREAPWPSLPGASCSSPRPRWAARRHPPHAGDRRDRPPRPRTAPGRRCRAARPCR